MEPEVDPILSPNPEAQPSIQADRIHGIAASDSSFGAGPEPEPYRGLKWIFIGDGGLRAGWSVSIFLPLLVAMAMGFGMLFARLHLTGGRGDLSARTAL